MMDGYYMGIPWGTEAYICPSCKEANFRLWPFCPRCGARQDPRKVFKPRASRPPISKPDELKETLAKLRGHRVRLWDYLISHSVLQLRVAHFAHHGYSSKRNTLIVCTLTKHINVPTEAWDSNLALDIGEDESGKVYR